MTDELDDVDDDEIEDMDDAGDEGDGDDSWDFYLTEREGNPAAILVCLGLAQSIPLDGLPWLHVVSLPMKSPGEGGLSSNEERETLDAIDDALTEALQTGSEAVYVGRIMEQGRMDFCFYAEEKRSVQSAVDKVLRAFPGYTATTTVTSDPEWTKYADELFPDRHGRHQILNRQVIIGLHEEGDPLTTPREVNHWIFFPTEAARAEFVAQAAEQGFTADLQEPGPRGSGEECDEDHDHAHEHDHDADSDEIVYGVCLTREDSVEFGVIDDLTADLEELAESFGGEYDGWEAAVVREEE